MPFSFAIYSDQLPAMTHQNIQLPKPASLLQDMRLPILFEKGYWLKKRIVIIAGPTLFL